MSSIHSITDNVALLVKNKYFFFIVFFRILDAVASLVLSSSGSRPCPGQLQKTSRSKETQRHSLVSGLDLEIDSIITPYHHHPPTHHPPEKFFEQNNI